MSQRRDGLPASLADIARLINDGQIHEADQALVVIERDLEHPAWHKPLTISILRDRIKKGMA